MGNNKKHRQGAGPNTTANTSNTSNNHNRRGTSRPPRNRSHPSDNRDDAHGSSSSHEQPAQQQQLEEESDETALDFCQTFFGDPLFTNFHVSLLFFTAAFLPVVFWIPRVLVERRRRRRLLEREKERARRMEMAREAARALQAKKETPAAVQREFTFTSAAVEGGDEKEASRGERDESDHARDNHINENFEDDVLILPQRGPLTKSTLTHTEDVDVLSHDDFLIPDDAETMSRPPTQQQHTNNEFGSAASPTRQHQPTHDDNQPHPEFQPLQPTILPTLCPDGVTYGFDDWYTLRDAILEANAIAAEDFLRWNEYLLQTGQQLHTQSRDSSHSPFVTTPSYPPPEPFVICPGVTLTRRSRLRPISLFSLLSRLASWIVYDNPLSRYIALEDTTLPRIPTPSHPHPHHGLFHTATPTTAPHANRPPPPPKLQRPLPQPPSHSPLFLNAEDLLLECRDCTIRASHTHLSFGPHAKRVKVRGITFRGATTSSVTFHHHGADVAFEDCYWLQNSGGIVGSGGGGGGGDDDADRHRGRDGADGRGRHSAGGTNHPHSNVHSNSNSNPNAPTHAGAVADLNSTSTVTFYRCVIDDHRQTPRRANVGAGVANVPGMNPPAGHLGGGTGPGGSPGPGAGGGSSAVSSSLTIRN